MDKIIKWKFNGLKNCGKASTNFLSKKEVAKAKNFHESFPQYKRTPVAALNNLAKEIGLGGIYLKDESY